MISKAFEIADLEALVSTGTTVAAVGILLWIAVQDIRYHRIRNRAVLTLLLLYLPQQGGFGFPHFTSDLLAGGTLFGVGFLLWLVRALGAGDAKLMLALGLLLGIDGLQIFAFYLFSVTLLFVITSRLSTYFQSKSPIFRWLSSSIRELHTTVRCSRRHRFRF